MTQSDYDQFAEAYATANAEGFFNTWYEKPAMLRLLGDVTGHRILDAGCGSGPTSVALTERGADVSGFDLSAAMIEIARRRLPGTDLQVHDLAEPLPGTSTLIESALMARFGRKLRAVELELRDSCRSGGSQIRKCTSMPRDAQPWRRRRPAPERAHRPVPALDLSTRRCRHIVMATFPRMAPFSRRRTA